MNDNFNEDFWWEAIDEYVVSEIMEFESNLNDYYSHLQILFIDEHDVDHENGGGMRFHKSVSFDNVDELESYIGSEEVKKWKSDFKNLSSEQKSIQHETSFYVSNENGYEFLTSLILSKINFMETLSVDCDECFDSVLFCDSTPIHNDDDWVRVCNNCK